tara:strand:- start:377 stop:1216 length:840 start_codon:yes stop_codon:yes gene_type:complete
MNKYLSIIQIIRPLNVFISLIATIIAALLINQINSPLLPFVCCIIISFVAASNVINDIYDVSIDKINKPKRTLVLGSLSILTAKIIVFLLYTLGSIASLFIHYKGGMFSIFIILPLLILYTPFIKKIVFIGNIFVGTMLGFVFAFTELSIMGHVDKMLVPFLLATTLSTIREIIKDCSDIVGDSIFNVYTLPSILGFPATLWIIRFIASLLCFLGIIPFILNMYGFTYFLLLLTIVELPLIWLVYVQLNITSSSSEYIFAAKALKGITFGGLMVILFTI